MMEAAKVECRRWVDEALRQDTPSAYASTVRKLTTMIESLGGGDVNVELLKMLQLCSARLEDLCLKQESRLQALEGQSEGRGDRSSGHERTEEQPSLEVYCLLKMDMLLMGSHRWFHRTSACRLNSE